MAQFIFPGGGAAPREAAPPEARAPETRDQPRLRTPRLQLRLPLVLLGLILFATPTAGAVSPTQSIAAKIEALRNEAIEAGVWEEPRSELPASIRSILEARPVQEARAGVLVRDLETGEEVFAKNADELLNPASNMKLLTTIAALQVLGPSYRFPTELYVDEEPKAGLVRGALYLRGKGDPSLTTERLYRIVRELKHQGVREIAGNLVIDDTYFDDVYDGPGWEQDDSDRPYMAGAGAVSLNFNSVGIHVYPGEGPGAKARIELEPASDYLILENLGETGPARSRGRVQASSIDEGQRQRITVRARLPAGSRGQVVYRRISNPPRYTGETFRTLLLEQGVKLRGKVVLGQVPEGLSPLYVDYAEPLSVLVHKLNKWSQNHMSEMLLKTMGATAKGSPGTWAKGAAAIEDFLAAEVGIPRGSLVLQNGSGLNDTNRVSARQLVNLLAWVHERSRIAPELLASLPIAGVDGTTRNRLGGTLAQGRVRAKTGTLHNVTALSGIADAVGGKQYAFAILVNDYPGSVSAVLPRVDAIGAALASVGSPGGSRSAVALASPPPSDPTTPIEILRTRMRTFSDLGLAAVGSNATLLRTALRSERDPALRAVIAEALYRAAPDDPGAASQLLEAFSVDAEVFDRLRAAVRGTELPIPIVDTLLDLGAGGDREAIDHLLLVARRFEAGDPAWEELAWGLAEIGRNAPDELLASLEAAGPQEKEATVALLRFAIGLPPDPQELSPIAPHPFNISLAKAAQGADPQLASFARALEDELTKAREPAEPSDEVIPASIAP